MTAPSIRSLTALSVRSDGGCAITRTLPEETAVAIVCNGGAQAVMMATPADLEDFAIGFALSEGFIESLDEIESFELAEHEAGVEARIWLSGPRAAALKARRRTMAGPIGCGLCGIESLEQAMRPLPKLPSGGPALSYAEVNHAVEALQAHQPLHDQTRAVHAAGFVAPGKGVIAAREDVGRHNALDKLIGAMARQGLNPGSGAFVLTSRVSVDMVQKAVIAACPILIAASAPTVRALRLADEAGLTLAAFARGGGFDLFTHPQRVQTGVSDVA